MANEKLDLIDRGALMAQFDDSFKGFVMKRIIEMQPKVDAVPVVHGRWAHLGGDEWCCTACGEVIHTEGSWEKPDKKYCYECGADMRGDEDG